MTNPPVARATAGATLLALALLALLAATGCGADPTKSEGSAEAAAAPVTVTHAGSPAGDALVLPARVTARDEVTLTARLAARLTELPVREGARFRKGDALARFDAPETRAALDGARAGLAAATLARDLARRQESRMDSLFAARVAAQRELEGAQAERRGAEAAWAQSRAQVDQMASGTTLEAPFDGVVVRLHADPGTTVGPGQPVLDVRSHEVGEITSSVPESELARLAGARVEYQVGEGPWRPATLVNVDGMTDFATRSRVARFRPARPTVLEAGAFGRVRLAASRPGGRAKAPAGGSLSVPASALVIRGGLSGVFVAESGVARLRWLRIGRVNGGAVEVLAGLDSGDDVIVNPAGLSDGRPVRVTP
jgi:RND family efflux transporter MFP subunit